MTKVPSTPGEASRVERPALTDLLEIYWEPQRVFQRRATTSIWLPLAFLVIATSVLHWLYQSAMEDAYLADFRRALAAMAIPNGLSLAQLDASFRSSLRFRPLSGVFALHGAIFGVSLAVWVACRFINVPLAFGRAALVATWSYSPRIVEALVLPLIALLRSPENVHGIGSVTPGVTYFLDPSAVASYIYPFLLRLDLITVWVTVLIGIGVRTLTDRRATVVDAAIVAGLVYLSGSIGALFAGLRSF